MLETVPKGVPAASVATIASSFVAFVGTSSLALRGLRPFSAFLLQTLLLLLQAGGVP